MQYQFFLAFFSGLDDTCPMVAMPSASGLWTCRMPFAWPCAFRARLHYRSTGALPPDHCGSGLIPWSVVRSQRSRRLTFRPLRVFASLRESFPIFAFRFALGALVPWRLISVFRSALRFLRATLPLYPSKNESGKEKVKFFDLYQALTKVEGGGGKENGSDKVFCRWVLKFPAFSAFRFSLSALPWHMARAARTFYILPSSFCLSPLGRAPKTR